MVQNLKSRISQREFRFQTYSIFNKYYKNELLDKSIWPYVVNLLTEITEYRSNHSMKLGLKLISEVDEGDISQAIFDYNHLFVGPGKILAPAYESYYRNNERLLMQQETLEVREFYQRIGLQIAELGREPDDHLAFELELICYLLSKNNDEVCWDFFDKHLGIWITTHCNKVLEHSKTDICKGMANILKGFIELEQEEHNYFRGGVRVEE